jgi:aspartokinase/homoserine dehydrogenase 1
MLVLKFGGTSVLNSENIKKIIAIIKQKKETTKNLFVVVSAMGGVTDKLLTCASLAMKKDQSYLQIIQEIEDRHLSAIEELIPIQYHIEIKGKIKLLLGELENVCKGIYILQEFSPNVNAQLVSFGELLSSNIISQALHYSGIKNTWLDSRDLITTVDNNQPLKVDFELTNKTIEAKLKGVEIGILPGFIARTKSGHPSTLGRGGSDYTSAIIAGALNADCLEIWSDVEGMYTSDPRLVEGAYSIDELSYEEAMELSYFGAKVLYTPTIHPLLEKNISLLLKNTFNPEHKGTLITSSGGNSQAVVKGLSCVNNMAMITITGSGMVGIPGIAARFFNTLSVKNINVYFITQSSSEHTISIGITDSDVPFAVSSIEIEFAYELSLNKISPLLVERKLSIVAIVGNRMKEQAGISGKAFSLLGSNGINVRAIAQGATERNISIVVNEGDAKKTLNVLHEGFFLSNAKHLNLFLMGPGKVGKELLEQIAEQAAVLKKENGIDIKLIGIANSTKMLFEEKGLTISNWNKELVEKGEKLNVPAFVQQIKKLNLANSVLVDCTASEEIAAIYIDALKSGVSVVAANKIAASSAIKNLQAIKTEANNKKVKFLYETNVAAGLPVLKTIQDLKASGDKILKIEAVLSGSLNFIFNTISEKVKFSEAVSQAKDLGYTEPDPFIDLSGKDVMRKLLILARESGYAYEMADVASNPLLPTSENLYDLAWPVLLEKLKSFDEHIEAKRKAAVAKGNILRFMARLQDGKASVGITEVSADHVAYNLKNADNVVLIETKRYSPNPMIIKGAGAGTEVTAAGVFGDILKISNF